jgi:hypothetical protein
MCGLCGSFSVIGFVALTNPLSVGLSRQPLNFASPKDTHFDKLRLRHRSRRAIVAVIGLGCVGLPSDAKAEAFLVRKGCAEGGASFVFRTAVKPSMAAPGETPVSRGSENKLSAPRVSRNTAHCARD